MTHEQVPEWKKKLKGFKDTTGRYLYPTQEEELESFIHSTLQDLVKAIVEKENEMEIEKGTYMGTGCVSISDILSVAKEQFGVELPE